MHIRSSALAAVAIVAVTGFAQAQPSPDAGTIPPAQVPPNTVPTPAPAPAAGTSLQDVKSPKTTLMGAKVKDSKGEAIGEVKTVQLDADGKVVAVNVDAGGKIVTLKAETLTYAQLNNTLTSTQTKAEIAP